MIPKNISNDQLRNLRALRWKCRTDLLYLCNNVLRYRDVVPDPHGPLVDILQQFPLPPPDIIRSVDIVEPGLVEYRPWMDMYELPGKRRRLILDPRSGLKTTINCISHTIQWLINFPWATIIIFQATGDKATEILREIREHFQYNELFRSIFPDLVPHRGIKDWGNSSQFFVPTQDGRAQYLSKYKMLPRKEPSVYAVSLDSGTAGKHYDIMKFSDVVDNNNSKTELALKDVINNFRVSENILVRPDGWMDVEGTRYHFNDLYGDIMEKWLDEEHYEGFRDQWDIHVRGCFLRKGQNIHTKFTPDLLTADYQLDENGKRISWWPVSRDGKPRFTTELLEIQERDDPVQFSCQRLNHPQVAADAYFPLGSWLWVDREDYWKIPISHHTVTVDTAETISGRSDYSVIMVTAWDNYGRGIVHDIRWGKYKPSEIVDHIFDVNARYRPQMIYIEETGFVRGLRGDLERSMAIGRRLPDVETTTKDGKPITLPGRVIPAGTYLPIDFSPRNNQEAKLDRILHTLEPRWREKSVRFLTDLGEYPSSPGVKEELIRQIERFPKGKDDIMDALADQFATKTWFGRERGVPNTADITFDPTKGVLTGLNEWDNSTNANPRLQYEAHKQQQEALRRMLIPDPDQSLDRVQDPYSRRTGAL